MPRLSAPPIMLSAAERVELESLVRAHSTPQQLALRARIILLAADGVGVRETARRLEVWAKTVRRWQGRWRAASAGGPAAQRLSDAPRSGAPATFTPEQICAIIALACEPPAASGRPITHWTQQEVADEAVRRGLVQQILQRSVGRFFKRIRPETASDPVLADAETGPTL